MNFVRYYDRTELLHEASTVYVNVVPLPGDSAGFLNVGSARQKFLSKQKGRMSNLAKKGETG